MRIVVIGGGTGTIPVLTGLKKFTKDLSAIVTMADSGGHSGFLRDELGVLPPGDVRNCIISLADEKKKAILRKLLDYRLSYPTNGFQENVGNVILTALSDISGGFPQGVVQLSKLLEIEGAVLPVTTDNTHLVAKLENGKIIYREKNIDQPIRRDGRLKIEKVWLSPKAKVNLEAKKAILNAEIIVLGPGDLFTSLIPNLLVKDVPQMIRKSNAKKIYVVNLMTKFGETHNFKAIDFVNQIEKYLGKNVLNYVLVNKRKFSPKLLKLYAKEKSYPVIFNKKDFQGKKYQIYLGDLAQAGLPANTSPEALQAGNLIRHSAEKLAKVIMYLGLAP